MESGVDFVACDNPHANKFTIHIMAAVAEHEALMISDRTKSALKAAKAKSVKLGSAREGKEQQRILGSRRGSEQAAIVHASNADADLYPAVQELREQGATYRTIADALNEQGVHNPTG